MLGFRDFNVHINTELSSDFKNILYHENLLENPFFTVNQREQNSYTEAGYTVDKWIRSVSNNAGHTLTLGSGVTIPNHNIDFYQVILEGDNTKRKFEATTYTMSALIDSWLLSWTFTWNNDGQTAQHGHNFGASYDKLSFNILENWGTNIHLFGINNNGCANDHTIYAVKLEKGSVSTLSMDPRPRYSDTLVKCSTSPVWNGDPYSGKTVSYTDHNHTGVYSPVSHTHDDRYYTETETNNLLTSYYGINNSNLNRGIESNDAIPYFDAATNTPKKFYMNILGTELLTHENLLDNPWFTINQREETVYTPGDYTVDRWVASNYENQNRHKLYVGTNGIYVNNFGGDLYQVMDLNQSGNSRLIANYYYTLSALIDWQIYSFTFQVPTSTDSKQWFTTIGLDGLVFNVVLNWGSYGRNLFAINNAGSTKDHTVQCMKLEKGKLTTIYLDSAPNYQTELFKCKRYFQRLGSKGNTVQYGTHIGMGFYLSASEGYVIVPGVPMAKAPTLNVVGSFAIGLNASTVTGVQMNKNFYTFYCSGSYPNNAFGMLQNTNAGPAYIDLIANP